ncbi:MAG: hypothetical protein LJE67_12870 [Salaquimonas sp.]|nr:hypothetical protein [Salaquimonas sp.]
MWTWLRIIGYGILVWLIPFFVAFAAFALRDSNRALFESIMAVTVAAVATLFSFDYLRRLGVNQFGAGVLAGLIWMVISIAIELPLMLPAPIALPLADYLGDIALTFVMIPIIAAGIGAAFARAGTPGG